MIYYDIHTHQPAVEPDVVSVVNILIKDRMAGEMAFSGFYSLGIHPWYITNVEEQMALLRDYVSRPEVVAIGEAGLDKYAEADMDIQIGLFRKQAILAEETGKPLIIHCVKAWAELLAVLKALHPRMPWILHGFRGNAELADQLLRQGFVLSFGPHFQVKALQKAWPDRVLVETDDASVSIREVYERLCVALDISLNVFASQIAENVKQYIDTQQVLFK